MEVSDTAGIASSYAPLLDADRKPTKVLADEAHVRENVQLDVTYQGPTELKDRLKSDGMSALFTEAANCDPWLLRGKIV